MAGYLVGPGGVSSIVEVKDCAGSLSFQCPRCEADIQLADKKAYKAVVTSDACHPWKCDCGERTVLLLGGPLRKERSQHA